MITNCEQLSDTTYFLKRSTTREVHLSLMHLTTFDLLATGLIEEQVAMVFETYLKHTEWCVGKRPQHVFRALVH